MLKVCVFYLSVGLLPSLLLAAEVPVVSDLRQEAKLSQQSRLPLLISFSAEECHYCELIEEDFLEPLLLRQVDRDRVIIRKLELDGEDVRGFDGVLLSPAALARFYGVTVTPTVLFLDSKGEELSERLIGISTPDLFGAYLEQSIDQARVVLREALVRLPKRP
ncbi:MAG: thioredoxin fold domain-containing protein [Gammaproteobacteria bacterium]|nr:thioredoxin fold domain-containing protein [Gammaproteobacteria bacterium]